MCGNKPHTMIGGRVTCRLSCYAQAGYAENDGAAQYNVVL